MMDESAPVGPVHLGEDASPRAAVHYEDAGPQILPDAGVVQAESDSGWEPPDSMDPPEEPWTLESARSNACQSSRWGEDGFAGFGVIGGPSLALEEGENGILFVGYGGSIMALDTSRGPEEARVLSQVSTSWKARQFALQGDYLYSTTASKMLAIVDISDPSNLRLVDEIEMPVATRTLAVSGSLLVTGTTIRDGTHDVTYQDPDGQFEGQDLQFEDTPQYKAQLLVYDISDPSTAELLTTTDISAANVQIGEARALHGTHLVINAPSIEPQLLNWNGPRQMWCAGIAILDLADPKNPAIVTRRVGHEGWPWPYSDSCTESAVGVVIDSNYVFASSGHGVHVYDVSAPEMPRLVRRFRDYVDGEGVQRTIAPVRNLRLDGEYLYASINYAGGQPAAGAAVLDRRGLVDPGQDPNNSADDPPALVDVVYGIPDSTYHAAQIGDEIYMAHDDGGLISVNRHTDHRTQVLTPSSVAYSSVIVGQRMFIADFNTGVLVADISDPSQPRFVGAWERPNRETTPAPKPDNKRIARDDRGFVYLSAGHAGLVILDGHATGNDFEALGTFGKHSPAWAEAGASGETYLGALATHGTYVYIYAVTTAEDNSILVLDAADPTRPRFVRSIPLNRNLYDLGVRGNQLFALGWSRSQGEESNRVRLVGTHIFDISEPEAPRLAHLWDLGSPMSIAFHGNLAYVAGHGRFDIFALSEVSHPEWLSDPGNPEFTTSNTWCPPADPTEGSDCMSPGCSPDHPASTTRCY